MFTYIWTGSAAALSHYNRAHGVERRYTYTRAWTKTLWCCIVIINTDIDSWKGTARNFHSSMLESSIIFFPCYYLLPSCFVLAFPVFYGEKTECSIIRTVSFLFHVSSFGLLRLSNVAFPLSSSFFLVWLVLLVWFGSLLFFIFLFLFSFDCFLLHGATVLYDHSVNGRHAWYWYWCMDKVFFGVERGRGRNGVVCGLIHDTWTCDLWYYLLHIDFGLQSKYHQKWHSWIPELLLWEL